MCTGAAEGLFVQALAREMGLHCGDLVMMTDASAAKAIAERSSMPTRVKHMAIRYLFLQQLVREKRIHLLKVPSGKN